MKVLRTLVQKQGITAIVATHDSSVIDLADQTVELRDGKIVPCREAARNSIAMLV